MPEIDVIRNAIQRITARESSEADIQTVLTALAKEQLILVEGSGAVGAGGNISNSQLITENSNTTGDGNTFHNTAIHVYGANTQAIKEVLDQHLSTAQEACVVGLETLPSIHFWIGRDAKLETLKSILRSALNPVVVLIGQGGVGKTSLALKLLEELGVRQNSIETGCLYQKVIVVNIRENSEFSQAADFILNGLGINSLEVDNSDEVDNPGQKIKTIIRELANKKSLLLLDNLETILNPAKHKDKGRAKEIEWSRLLNSLANKNHCSQILITSRESIADLSDYRAIGGLSRQSRVEELIIEGITVEESISLLRNHGLDDNYEDLKWVAKRVQGHPLILDFLAALAKGKPGYLRKNSKLVTHSAKELLEVQINRQAEQSKVLLYLICLQTLPPKRKQISFEQIVESAESVLPQLEEPFIERYKTKVNIEQLIKQLVDGSLLQERYDEDLCDFLYDVHPVVSDFTKEILLKENSKIFLKAAELYYDSFHNLILRSTQNSLMEAVESPDAHKAETSEFLEKLKNSQTASFWISESINFLVEYSSFETLSSYSNDLSNEDLLKNAAGFKLSVKQFLQQVAFCLSWGNYDILDSPEIPLVLEVEDYEATFQKVATKAIPKGFSNEVVQEIQACIKYLVERLPFY